MPKMKTRKSLVKKVKITKTGKVIARKTGQNHFNAKDSGKTTRSKRSDRQIINKTAKNIKKAIHG